MRRNRHRFSGVPRRPGGTVLASGALCNGANSGSPSTVHSARFRGPGTGVATWERSASLFPAPCARRLRNECLLLRWLLPESCPLVCAPDSTSRSGWRSVGAVGSRCAAAEGRACGFAPWEAGRLQLWEASWGLLACGTCGRWRVGRSPSGPAVGSCGQRRGDTNRGLVSRPPRRKANAILGTALEQGPQERGGWLIAGKTATTE